MPKTRRFEISVIIPFHGNPENLFRCLKGLREQRFDAFEVIVVASGIERDHRVFESFELDITIVAFDAKMPPGKARNTGADMAKADLLAFIDSDCVPDPLWLSGAFSSLKSGHEIVVGPITDLLPFHPIASIDNLLLFPDFQKHRPSWHIAHFPGCNFAITKALFTKTGGFAESLQIGEDTIFSRSAIANCRGKIGFDRRMLVRHKGRTNVIDFIDHHQSFGYHRKYHRAESAPFLAGFRRSFIYAALFGARRLLYVVVRTAQLNPFGLLKAIAYFPVLIVGIFAWMKGFWCQHQIYSDGSK